MIHLRELTRADLGAINRYRQDREVVDLLGAPFRFIGPEIDVRWFDSYLTRRGTDVRLAICPTGSEQLVGLVSLTGIDTVHRNGEFHIMLGDAAARGKGYGTAATRLMLQHAFDDLNLHRVYLSVLANNKPALRIYEKVGFRLEGTAREAVYKRGSYHDLLHMGVLQSELRPDPGSPP